MIKINENIWGHKYRLTWFKKFVTKEQLGLEFGCGTGIMITSQLTQDGYNCIGIDLDKASIDLGNKIFAEHGLPQDRLFCKDLNTFPDNHFDYILASEVFEHIEKSDIDAIVELLKAKLKPEGIMIVTVPNGFGWHEFEEIFWAHLNFRRVFRFLYISQAFNYIRLKSDTYVSKYPSTIAHSPHVRRFTLNSIKALCAKHNFEVFETRGSVFFSGGFSDMLFSGVKPIMALTRKLGEWWPSIATGFYLATRNKK
ncbi:MAG: class I SAM-dependent methyltransferase [Bacteroidetes bacterium]|nr:class I SAM-dependent methyltransferase [Bacteroidota bacterium]